MAAKKGGTTRNTSDFLKQFSPPNEWRMNVRCSCGEVLTGDIQLILGSKEELRVEGDCAKCNHRCGESFLLSHLLDLCGGLPHPCLYLGGASTADLLPKEEKSKKRRRSLLDEIEEKGEEAIKSRIKNK